MKKNLLTTLFLCLTGLAHLIAQPTTAATAPTRSSTDVLSLFSDTYTNVSGTDWFPNWGQSTQVADITVEGNTTKRYLNLNYQGVQFGSGLNVSTMTHLHLDVWTPNCTAFDVYLINTPGGERPYTITPTLSGWNSIDIPLSHYTAAGGTIINLSNIGQFKLVGTPFGTSEVYLDNIYFWKPAGAPTLSDFTIPAKNLGDAAFTLTAPTSNSPGTFTYTSGNTGVATVSGNTVTIVGVGSTVITATQAAAGGYSEGIITATLVVSYPPPPTAAATPPARDVANVISLFSDAYTNVADIGWNPGWGQSTIVSDVTVVGNATKKYENLNYQGVQLASPIDVSAMANLHIDIWTPNCTSFKVSLINQGSGERAYTITPTLSGWNSIDIPLSSYTSVGGGYTVNLSNIGQLKFEGVPVGSSTVYFDNLYFWKPAGVVPTLSNFTVPAKVMGDAPFTLTAPTSNSAGTFTYTSGNTNVATISGNTVTIVGAGSAIITATQAADGSYAEGAITATLVVAFGPPLTAAPTPTRVGVNSLFSDAYTNLSGTEWNPNWGQSTQVSDIMVAGNTTKKYDNLNYQGVQFASPIDATSMTHLHLDVWTPNCTAFEVFFINAGPVERAYTINPTLSGWTSVDIPLSHYTPTINLSSIIQFKFVGTPFGSSTVYLDNIYLYNSSLPVELISFEGRFKNNKSVLTWKTASEKDNQGFTVERSANGQNFETIGEVKGVGNTNTVQNYTFTDANPLSGINYYRLRQMDYDGTTTYSKAITIVASQNDIIVKNTVANETLEITVNSENAAVVSIFNTAGQAMMTEKVQGTQNINISHLTSGMYFVRSETGAVSRFVKQ